MIEFINEHSHLLLLIGMIIALLIVLFIAYKLIASFINKRSEKKKNKTENNIYKDVFKTIKNTPISGIWPSYFVVYDGNMDAMLDYIGSFTNTEQGGRIVLNENHVILIDKKRIIFALTFDGIDDFNVSEFNRLTTRLFNKCIIRMPVVLIKNTTKEYCGKELIRFQRCLSDLQIFRENPYDVHVSVIHKTKDDYLATFYNLVKSDTEVVIEPGSDKSSIGPSIEKMFESIRDRFSYYLATENHSNKGYIGALIAASNIEKTSTPTTELLSELVSGEYTDSYPNKVVLNIGIDKENLHNRFFDTYSSIYKRKFKYLPLVASSLIIMSLAMTCAFGYNAYRIHEFNERIATENTFNLTARTSFYDANIEYQKLNNEFHDAIIFDFLYDDTVSKVLNERYARYLLNNVLVSNFQNGNDDIINSIYLALFSSLDNNALKNILKRNMPLLTMVTGLDEEKLHIVIDYGRQSREINKAIDSVVGTGTPHISAVINELSSMPKEVSDYFFENQAYITNSQLIQFIDSRYIFRQQICFVDEVSPILLRPSNNQTLNVRNTGTTEYVSSVYKQISDSELVCDSDYRFFAIQNLIPEENDTPIDSFHMIVDRFYSYNMTIDEFFTMRENRSLDVDRWKKILLKAESNTILVSVLNEKNGQIDLLNKDVYFKYEFKPVFAKQTSKLPLAYSKNMILHTITDMYDKYQVIREVFSKYDIYHGAYDHLLNGASITYAQNYVNIMRNVLTEFNPQRVTLNNLPMYLIDLTSDNTPFANMLTYISANTTFEEGQIPIETLNLIPDSFRSFNEFIHSDSYREYKEILLSISNNLYQDNNTQYGLIYEGISSSEDGSLGLQIQEMMSTLSQLVAADYRLFAEPITIIREIVTDQLVKDVVHSWRLQVGPVITKAKRLSPLNSKSSQEIPLATFNYQFGVNGTVYTHMMGLLKPFIDYDPVSRKWVITTKVTEKQSEELTAFLSDLNYIYRVQRLLWDESGNPQPINIYAQPQPFSKISTDGHTMMVLSFLKVGNDVKVLGMATNDQSNQSIEYNWESEPVASIGWISQNNQSYLNTYNGAWALFRLISDARCTNDWICTWDIMSDNSKADPYQVTFQFSGEAFNTLDQKDLI